jgi:hypothetical protein
MMRYYLGLCLEDGYAVRDGSKNLGIQSLTEKNKNMAKRTKQNNPSAEDLEKAFGEDVKFKSYKNDGSGFDDFEIEQEIIGVLVSIRDHSITDRRTKKPKDIRVYSIRIPDGTVLKIGGRTILDRLFDDIMDENGGFDVQNRRYTGTGYDYLKDKAIKMNRGKDTRTGDGNPLGTYEVAVEED